jgi:O-antigen ligase
VPVTAAPGRGLSLSAVAGVLALGMVAVPLAFDHDAFDAFALPHLVALSATAAALVAALAWHGFAVPATRLGMAALGAAAVAIAASWAGAQDPITAILGSEGYRHGAVAYLALAVAFAAAMTVARDARGTRWVLILGGAAAAMSGVYALVQWQGGDPFEWSAPAGTVFSTAGNENDLAAYAVAGIAFAAPFVALKTRRSIAMGAAVVALCVGQVVLSGSRTGLAATGLALVTWLAVAAVQRRAYRVAGAATAGLAVLAVLVVAVLSSAVPGLGGEEGEAAAGGSDAVETLDIRRDIWKGSLRVFAAHPLFGAGPGGLYTEFSRHERGGETFLFERRTGTGFDPVAASAHNAVIEAASTAGIAGVAALLVGVTWLGLCGLRVVRSGWEMAPPLAGALVGFALMAMLNPVPLPALFVATVLCGIVAGRADGAAITGRAWRIAPGACLGAAAIAGLVVAALAMAASGRAGDAAQAMAAARDVEAARHAERAASLAPFDASVRRLESITAWNRFVATNERADLEMAWATTETFLEDFPGLASDYIRLARLRLALGLDGVDEALDEARAASPHGAETRAALEAFPGYPSD